MGENEKAQTKNEQGTPLDKRQLTPEQQAQIEELRNFKPKEEQSLIIFGRDVSKIPCFRNSMLYGIEGGLGLGLLHFLFKSHVLKACNFAVYSFCGITTVYWIQCRYKYSKTKHEMMRLQEMLRIRSLMEGTSKDVKDN